MYGRYLSIPFFLLPLLFVSSCIDRIEMHVYPNPTSDYLIVELPEELRDYISEQGETMPRYSKIEVIDLRNGDKVLSLTDPRSRINVSSLPVGSYQILTYFYDSDLTGYAKFVKIE